MFRLLPREGDRVADKRSRIRSAIQAVVGDENLDLYVLAVVALLFTVLGVTGVSDVKTLSSVVLALLAVLAYSQIRSSKQIRLISRTQGAGSTTVLRRDFPRDLIERRASASDLLLIGLTMTRTIQGMRSDLPAILRNGGRVRVLVLDPTDESLIAATDRQRSHSQGAEHFRQRVLTSLQDLTTVRERVGGRLEIRVLSSIPTAGFNCLDVSKPNGLVCVQHYEFHPAGEAAPIMSFTVDDMPWYAHFAAEAERLWEAGIEWPLTTQDRLSKAPRPAFIAEFGLALSGALETAQTVLITGITRNTFLTSQFNELESRLRDGQTMRFLLVDPSSSAVDIAAERYYAHRSGDTARERIRASLRLLGELKKLTGGDMSVRLTDYPLTTGLIVVNPGHVNAAVFVEYYTYQARGEPKFVMRPEDGYGYDTFLNEGELLWEGAKPYKLD
jgi:hypothetical protein